MADDKPSSKTEFKESRRSKAFAKSNQGLADDIMPADDMPTTEKAASATGEKKGRRVSGWDIKMTSSESEADRLERERLKPKEDEDDDDQGIPVIPELEEQRTDDIGDKIASAPSVAVNRVATYRELDEDLLRHAAFVILDNDIDLKLLTKCLASEADVNEEDTVWEWDRLFTEVTTSAN